MGNTWRAKHLIRRRFWDSLVVAIGGGGLPFRQGLTTVSAFFFAVIGIYLVLANHRGSRKLAPWLHAFALAYFCWAMILMASRGEPILDNRQSGYVLLIATLTFIANGLVLVRDPIRMFVIGSRVGIVVVALFSLALVGYSHSRFGMGGNPAPFAMVTFIALLGSIIPIRSAPMWAPNTIGYAFIGAVPIFQSDTRAILLVIPVVIIAELLIWFSSKSPKIRLIGLAGAIGFVVLAASSGPIKEMSDRRLIPVIQYYAGLDVDDQARLAISESGDARLLMWSGAIDAWKDAPLTGFGTARMSVVQDHLQPRIAFLATDFRHLHNVFLDEALMNGFVGLALMIGIFVCATVYILRRQNNFTIRRNIFYFLLAFLLYGSLHNPLTHETTIGAIMFYLGVMISSSAKRTGIYSQANFRSGG